MTKSKPPVSSASREAIQHHYDVGNRFYSLFLDKRMVYSCALYQDGDDLEEAQIRKLDYHLDQACAGGAESILEIGCGWGALLERAKAKYNVRRPVGLTLSEAQRHFFAARGIKGIDVRLESWEDHEPQGPYDAIVSIGAFEHFARPDFSDAERIAHYRGFFRKCREWLKPGGRVSLQTITYDNMDRKDRSPFISDVIFPESDLPKLSELAEASDGLFSILTVRNDAADYEKTCIEWAGRLRENKAAIVAEFGPEKFKTYYNYLALSSVGFNKRNMGLIRMTLSRNETPFRD